MIVFNVACQITKVKNQCISKSRESKFVSGYGVQRCQITQVVFYTKMLVNDILFGLERFNCIYCAFPLWYLEHSRDNTSYCFTVI